MPSCCGIAVVCELYVNGDQDYDEDGSFYEDDDFSLIFSQKTKDLWKEHWKNYCKEERVRQILATTTADMTLFEVLFKRTGWKALTVTKNPKTNSTITLWSYQI
jgi:hypothetical protein